MGHSSIWKLICAICVCNILTVGVHLSSTPSISGPGSATVNPFKPNGITHYYQLDQSIFILRVIRLYFSFYQNSNRASCKRTVETLIRRHILWRLIWVCKVCLCPTKRTLGIWVNAVKSIAKCCNSQHSAILLTCINQYA